MTEYGVGLADRVRTRGALGPDEAARLLLPVAQSLAAMHAAAGGHGAVSPAAIHVDETGHALLLAPARVAGDPRFAARPMSAAPPAAADDVWSFAALLLFLTTGRTLGQGETAAAAAVAPRDLGWLTPLVQLALAVDPRERPTMADVVDYLRARVPGESRRRVSTVALAVAGAALIIGLGAVGAALLLTGSPDAGAPPRVDGTTTQGSAPVEDGGPTVVESAESEEEVSAAELETFARRYVATASRDPRRGFGMLTRSYQQDSPRYREVWSAIQDPRILVIDPDPAALSVSYTYRYSLPGGDRRTEDVTLRLVERRGQLLIAGASAR